MLSWYRNTARARSMSWSALGGCRAKAYSAVGEKLLSKLKIDIQGCIAHRALWCAQRRARLRVPFTRFLFDSAQMDAHAIHKRMKAEKKGRGMAVAN